MYSEKLMTLIEMAIADGELSEKEKQILFKKAESDGIDLDEFEMVLDSILFDRVKKTKPEIKSVNSSNSESIMSLIDLALMDSDIDDKEKQVLFKKAESLGMDLDEFEMILNAKLFEKQQANKPTQSAAPKTDKFGDVKKCPSCGSIVQSFQTKCSDCGHEFSNVGANVSIGKLFDMLNACENERKEADNSISGAIGSMFAKSGIGAVDKIIEKKKSIISGFPIPNTKDDILEFLSIAIPNAKQKGNLFTKQQPENKSHNDLATTWQSKCEQIIMKAKFSMKEDKKTLEEILMYANELGIK
ncbi:MAG: hypothetical protein KA521_00705 [Crocinitomicaceae bacterium]|nr:hypothetical protein [Crocinitomicaceae bacterium]